LSEEEQRRDRELENLLGQFLVASFQSDKLAELIHDKLPFGGSKEVRIALPNAGLSRHSLVVSIRVEPYPLKPAKAKKEEEGDLKAVCVLETPGLGIGPSALRARVQEILEGSLEWWIRDGGYKNLSLEDWKLNVSVLDNKDSRRLSQVYTLLGNLEAKRKGELTR
jgi:hypothetical protein